MVHQDKAHELANRTPEQIKGEVPQQYLAFTIHWTGSGVELLAVPRPELMERDFLPVHPWPSPPPLGGRERWIISHGIAAHAREHLMADH
jgi:hypothetical protein